MYTCETCGAVVRTRQGLGGHIRFRHSEVEAPANRRPHTPTEFERKTADQLSRLEEFNAELARLVIHAGLLVCQVARQTPDIDPKYVFELQSYFLQTSLFDLPEANSKRQPSVERQLNQEKLVRVMERRAALGAPLSNR